MMAPTQIEAAARDEAARQYPADVMTAWQERQAAYVRGAAFGAALTAAAQAQPACAHFKPGVPGYEHICPQPAPEADPRPCPDCRVTGAHDEGCGTLDPTYDPTSGCDERCRPPKYHDHTQPAPEADEREALGRRVREVWVEWAQEQSNPKPSWLVGWDDLGAADREVDMRIGEALARRSQPAPRTVTAEQRDALAVRLFEMQAPDTRPWVWAHSVPSIQRHWITVADAALAFLGITVEAPRD